MARVTDSKPAQGREKEGGRVVLLMLVGLAALVAGAYAAAYFAAGDRVPRGTVVAGVVIGGLTPDEALDELETGLADREDAAIPVSVGGDSLRLRPARAGIAVDYAESVAAAGGGRSWDPARLWDYYTGGDELAAVVDIDEDAMASALAELADQVGTLPRNGSVEFRDGKVVVQDARSGQALDTETAREALESAYLDDERDAAVELSLVVAEPDIDTGDVQEALDSFANPAVSAPVTLLFGDSQIRLAPRDYGGVLQLRPSDGELVPGLDRQALTRLLDSRISTGEPVDATVSIVGGEPRVIKALPGVTYRPGDVEKTFLSLVAKPAGKREQRIEAVSATADFTTADARALEITERVSTFTTYFPYAEYRNTNIGRAAEIVDGTVLEPDEVSHLLTHYGIPMAAGMVVANAGEVRKAAAEIGTPVVVKIVSSSILHKSDVGGVRMHLASPEIAEAAAHQMLESLTVAGRDHEVEGFLVQEMVPSEGAEVFVGVTYDQLFGPLIACGAGGTMVELMHDVAVRITPLTDVDATEMLRSLKSWPLFEGYRGRPRLDSGSLEELLLRLSVLVEDLPHIAELDLNPVLVRPSLGGSVVLDARIRVVVPRPESPLGARLAPGMRVPLA